MNSFRYILEPYKTMKNKYHCPNCNKKTFTRYIDNTTQEQVNLEVGKCNRLVKCKYHFTPKEYFKNNNITPKLNSLKPIEKKPKTNISFIDSAILEKSINSKFSNFFIDYLASIWDYEIAYFLAEKYNIGTSYTLWNNSTVFWQVDIKNKVRTGKIMLYNASNGKRVKKPYNHINWVHKVLKLTDFNLEQCFFGEHLLNEDKYKPIAIVESEKTAIISSILLPDFIWLACGSVNNLNDKKTKVLKGRNVFLFPDLGCYQLWKDKIPKLTKLAKFKISNLLEKKATDEEKEQGLDIADFMVKLI